MPTVLDLLGFDGWSVHGFGASLLRTDSPWLAHPGRERLQIVRGVPDLVLERGSPVTFSANGPTMEIDGTQVLATSGGGLDFDDAVFVLAFGADGRLSGVCDDVACFEALKTGPPRTVVGVSTDPAFNERLTGTAGAGVAFLAGHVPESGSRLVAGRLSPGQARTLYPPGRTKGDSAPPGTGSPRAP